MSDVKGPSSLIQNSLKSILDQANETIDNLTTSPKMKSLGKAVTSAYGQVSDTTEHLIAAADHQIKHNLFVTGNGDPFLKVEGDSIHEVQGLPKLVIPAMPELNPEGKQGLVEKIFNAIVKLPATYFQSTQAEEGVMTWKSVREAFDLLRTQSDVTAEISTEEIYGQKITLWVQMLSQVKTLFESVEEKKGSEYVSAIVDILEVQLGEKEIPGDATTVGSDVQWAVIGRMNDSQKQTLLKVINSVQAEDGMIHAGLLSLDEAATALSALNDVIMASAILEERAAYKDLAGDGVVETTKVLSLKIMAEEAAADQRIVLMAAEDLEMIDMDKVVSWVNGEHEDFYIEGETVETRVSIINASRPWVDKTALALSGEQRELYTKGIQEALYTAIDWNREIDRRMVENGVNLEDDEQYVKHLIGDTKVLGWKEHQTQLFFGTMDVRDDYISIPFPRLGEDGLEIDHFKIAINGTDGTKSGYSKISLQSDGTSIGEVHHLFRESEKMIEGDETRSSWFEIPGKFKAVKTAEDYLDAFDEVMKLQSNPLTQLSAVHGRMQMKWLTGYARWLKSTIGAATMFTGHKFYFHTSRFAKSHLPEWKLQDEYDAKISKYHPNMLQTMNAGLAKNIDRVIKTYQWEDGHNAFALTTIGILSAFAGIGLAGALRSSIVAVETQIGWRVPSATGMIWNTARGGLFRRAWTRAAGTLLEFEAATVGFTVGTDAFMAPITGVPTFDTFSNNLMVNGVVFGVLDIAGFGLLKVIRANPVKGLKVLEGTSDAALGGLFKGTEAWGKESVLCNVRYGHKMAAETGFGRVVTGNLRGFGEYMRGVVPRGISALKSLPKALQGMGAGLKALNSRQLIKSGTGITGGKSGFLFSMAHYFSVVSLLHYSDVYLEPMDMAEPLPDDQKPSYLETAVHLAVIMAGARTMGDGAFFLRRVLEKQHEAELTKARESISAGLKQINEEGKLVGEGVDALRNSWKQEAERNGGSFDPRDRMVEMLDVVRASSVIKAAEVRMLDSEIDYSERGVDQQRTAIDDAMTTIASRLLMEYSLELAGHGTLNPDGMIAVSRGEVDLLVRKGKFFNKLFGDHFRLEQVESGSKETYYFRIVGTGVGLPSGRNLITDLVSTPGSGKGTVRNGLQMVRPGVYTPKTKELDGQNDNPTPPGGFETTNLM